ncbi:MAG: radical SAM family heme chaperone HemW [Bacteroidia bacterium]|nr:radical SAM family heme chaperone HemW [Bacteroidia bacterium]MDW8235674.1 radical SAM family heme chaperone HemW [Bacteroidia bacterium]
MLPDRSLLSALSLEGQTLGLYIHVPFCRKACHYCDFFFTPRASLMEAYTEALLREIHLYRFLLEKVPIETVFFGGGTPSWLPSSLWDKIFHALHSLPTYHPTEITIEANPEDISAASIRLWRNWGVTRISIGIQSFQPALLRILGRSHSPDTALQAINLLANSDLPSWNADVIFAIPGQTLDSLQQDLKILTDKGAPHLSLYGLTIEERTVLYKKQKLGRFHPIDEDTYAEMYLAAHTFLENEGYTWYEISNWAREGHECQHNWRYWLRKAYLGLGPAAHSYIPEVRWHNPPSLRHYLQKLLDENVLPASSITPLTAEETQEELWLTRFRTRAGIPTSLLDDSESGHALSQVWLQHGWVREVSGQYVLSSKGALLSDSLILQAIQTTSC